MLETSTKIQFRYATLVAVTLGVATLTACEATSSWLEGRKTYDAEPIILGAPETGQYLNDLYELLVGDPATQAEIYADAKARAQLTPGPGSILRYALVLAAPGHAETNALEAQSLFRELLARTELLTPSEISLATAHLREVEKRLVLSAEIRRLRSQNSNANRTEDEAVAQRMSAIEAENRRLRRSLAAAEQKLDAITSIERSIRDTGNK